MILSKVRDLIGDSPIVAHAYENERDFLDYEFARAKVIAWLTSAHCCRTARNDRWLVSDQGFCFAGF